MAHEIIYSTFIKYDHIGHYICSLTRFDGKRTATIGVLKSVEHFMSVEGDTVTALRIGITETVEVELETTGAKYRVGNDYFAILAELNRNAQAAVDSQTTDSAPDFEDYADD